MKPRVCVLKTDGTNCDQETMHAFQLAGADPQLVLINQLRAQKDLLKQFQILAIPGGFSYGDDIASGKILAVELMQFLYDQLHEFVAQGKLIIGICNGFQVLVRAQLLPQLHTGNQEATLLDNNSGKFECRWSSLKVEPTQCVFTKDLTEEIMLPVAHAEGKFFAQQDMLDELESQGLVVFRYAQDGQQTDCYPYNPNGSVHNIAGICDTTGRILGMMPHPERFIYAYQHPQKLEPLGLKLFKNAVYSMK